MRSKIFRILLASVVFLVLANYLNCSQFGIPLKQKTLGTDTGNPMRASAKILYSLCDVITRCHPDADYNLCEQGVKSDGINYQVGSPTTFSAYSSVIMAEESGLLTSNPQALDECSSAIASLSCDDPLVQASYNTLLDNPASGVTNVFPLQSSCSGVFAPSANLSATNYHYVRKGATGSGDGSDWNNACPDFVGSCAGDKMKRGDTYYVASGNYSGIVFDVPGTDSITIKKAVGFDHGTGVGWLDNYNVGPAAFAYWVFKSSNWVLDGNGRVSPTSGHGFQINLPKLANCPKTFCNAIFIDGDSNVDNVTVRFTDIVGYGIQKPYVTTAIYSAPGNGISSNITFSYGYIHDFGPGSACFMAAGKGVLAWTFENSVAARVIGMCLDDQGSTNITIRNNFFKDVSATAVILSDNSGGSLTTKNLSIYGNVFWESDSNSFGTSNGVIACINNNCSHWRIFNNSFVNFTSPGSLSGRIFFDQANANSEDNLVENNLWYNSIHAGPAGDSLFADYNAYFLTPDFLQEPHGQVVTGDPFIDSTGGNFHLKSPTAPGLVLTPPFDFDSDGDFRGADGNWDRGAFEFQ